MHIFLLPTKSRGEAKDWEQAEKNFFVRPAPNSPPPPLIAGSGWLGPPPLFWRSGSATAEVEALWLLLIKWMKLSHLKWIQPGRLYNRLTICFGQARNWGEGKAKRPVDKHLGPLFHRTHCTSDPDASSYWWEHWLLTGLIDIGFFGRQLARNLITKCQ